MNKPLSLVLLSTIGDLPYIDKKTGLVQTVFKPINANGETKYIKIPVSTLATAQECSASDTAAVDMVPDSKYKGILYFEDRGTGLGARRSVSQQYRSELRLVCWLNTLKINGGEPDMSFSAKAMNEIINIVTGKIISSSPFVNINATVSRIPEQNANIFSPYDYDERRTQYLFSPYDFFAVDLSVSFDLARNCIPDLLVTPPTKC